MGEMDPIYISLRLENDAGAGSWMSGYFTPIHHSHGGSYSYTSVCHCDGYSHVASLVVLTMKFFLSLNKMCKFLNRKPWCQIILPHNNCFLTFCSCLLCGFSFYKINFQCTQK